MLVIRPVELRDIEAVQNVARQSWIHTYKDIYPNEYIDSFLSRAYSAERLEQSIIRDQNDQGRKFLIAEIHPSEEVIGYVHVMKESEGIYELLRIYLLPENKGMGIGTELINEVQKLNGISKLKAWVAEFNQMARKFYEARDFKVINEKIQTDNEFTTKLICYEKLF